jgi:5-methylcytosine-specific restriction endonuclease McrA
MTYKSDLPCVVCGENRDGYVTMHHIYTQKSFPEYKDKEWNLISLCQKHHNEAHAMGNQSFAKKYASVSKWLEENGWRVFNSKLINRNMYE